MNGIEKFAWWLFFISLILIACLSYAFVKRLINIVKKSSKVLSDLKTINGKIKYKNIESNYCYSYDCLTRAEFNRFVLNDYFVEIIRDNEVFFKCLIKSIENNKKELVKYKRFLGKIDFLQTAEIAKSVKIPFYIYRHIEKKCYHKLVLLKPVIDVNIVCRKEYTTPVRRTHVWEEVTYNYKQLLYLYEETRKIKEQQEIRRGQI